MADEFSILPKWNRLLPAEKLGNSKESLVTQVEKEMPQRKRKRKKAQERKPEEEPPVEAATEEDSKESALTSGKIVDIVI